MLHLNLETKTAPRISRSARLLLLVGLFVATTILIFLGQRRTGTTG